MPRYSKATQAILAERWPHLFTFPVPLKVGIHRDYPPVGERPVSGNKFHHFMGRWVRAPEYLSALESATARYDFDGRMWPVRPWENDGGR